jgi:CheY-like chemotaxis protein
VRLRICRRLQGSIDGVTIDHLRIGLIYDVATEVASVLLAEGCAEPLGAADEALPSPRPPPRRRRAVILVVEDEPDLRQLTADLLVSHGFDVLSARHGREALERLCEHRPDLVLLDLNMPVMDGWQFRAAQARLEQSHLVNIPVLLLTGADAAPQHAATLNAVGVIAKPFHPDHLLDAVRTALRAA